MKFAVLKLIALLCVCACLVALVGCQPNVNAGAIDRASARTDALVHSSADIGVLADRLTIEVKNGTAATPANNVEAQKHWYGVGILIESVRSIGTYVAQVSGKIEADLKQAAVDRADMQKKLDTATSKGTAAIRWLQIIGVFGVGGFVVFGLLMKDFRIAVAGAVGSLVVIITAQFVLRLSDIPPVLWWSIVGIGGACVVWVAVEALIRGSVKNALKTNPLEDLFELFHRSGKGVATVTTPAGTVGVVGAAVSTPTPAVPPVVEQP